MSGFLYGDDFAEQSETHPFEYAPLLDSPSEQTRRDGNSYSSSETLESRSETTYSAASSPYTEIDSDPMDEDHEEVASVHSDEGEPEGEETVDEYLERTAGDVIDNEAEGIMQEGNRVLFALQSATILSQLNASPQSVTGYLSHLQGVVHQLQEKMDRLVLLQERRIELIREALISGSNSVRLTEEYEAVRRELYDLWICLRENASGNIQEGSGQNFQTTSQLDELD